MAHVEKVSFPICINFDSCCWAQQPLLHMPGFAKKAFGSERLLRSSTMVQTSGSPLASRLWGAPTKFARHGCTGLNEPIGPERNMRRWALSLQPQLARDPRGSRKLKDLRREEAIPISRFPHPWLTLPQLERGRSAGNRLP